MSDELKPSGIVTVALIVIGLVILVPSGLCTGVGLLTILSDPAGLDILPLVLMVGGPFVAIGGALLWAGIRRARRRSRSA